MLHYFFVTSYIYGLDLVRFLKIVVEIGLVDNGFLKIVSAMLVLYDSNPHQTPINAWSVMSNLTLFVVGKGENIEKIVCFMFTLVSSGCKV